MPSVLLPSVLISSVDFSTLLLTIFSLGLISTSSFVLQQCESGQWISIVDLCTQRRIGDQFEAFLLSKKRLWNKKTVASDDNKNRHISPTITQFCRCQNWWIKLGLTTNPNATKILVKMRRISSFAEDLEPKQVRWLFSDRYLNLSWLVRKLKLPKMTKKVGKISGGKAKGIYWMSFNV